MPATISIRRLEPRSEILKNRSSPPVGGVPTRTTLPVLVSVSAMLPPSGRQPAAQPGGEAGRSIGRPVGRRKARTPKFSPKMDRPNRPLRGYPWGPPPGGTRDGRPNFEAASDQGRTQGGGPASACRAPAQDGEEPTQPEGRVRCRRRPRRGGRGVRPHQAPGSQRHAGGPPRERRPGEADRRLRFGGGRRPVPAVEPGSCPRRRLG